jgi:hypothetical protein
VTVVGVLEFGWWYVAAGFVEAPVVEPVDVLEGGELDLLGGPPRPARLNELGLEQADDRLGEGIVVGVADGPDRRACSCCGQPLGEGDRVYCEPASLWQISPARLPRRSR